MIQEQFTANGNGTATRAGLYYRVSTPGQVEAYGYDVQRRLLPEHCARMGWEISGEYEEPGASGSSLSSRPAMMRLLEDARAHRFDIALAMEEKRFSRGHMLDWGYIIKTCEQAGVSLATPGGIFFDPASTESRMLLWVKGGMGEDEKREMLRRTMNAKKEAVKQGKIPHGTARYGYRFERYGRRGSEKNLVVVPEQAEIVRRIFDLAALERIGGAKISQRLNALGILSPHGGRWIPCVINRIIRDTVYRGEWPYCGLVAQVPAIVSPEVWEMAKRAFDDRLKHGRGRPGKDARSLLASYLRCEVCGMMFAPIHRTRPTGIPRCYYICGGRAQYIPLGRERCTGQRWRAHEIEDAVWAEIEAIIRSPEILQQMVAEADADLPADVTAELAAAQRALAAKQQEKERVIGFAREGIITPEELRRELEKVRAAQEEAEAHLARLHNATEAQAEWEQSIEAAIDVCESYREEIEHVTPERKRRIVEELVEEVRVGEHGEFTIETTLGTQRKGRVGELNPPS